MSSSYAGTTNAPDFPSGVDWLNVDRPLSLADFRGKVLLLDFWTYCCINCMHVIPALRRLEHDFPGELAVVGVHSAKFRQEQATESIRQAIMRYGVTHPVVNDADMTIWQSFAVRAWPTMMFIDPVGRVIGRLEGELTYDQGKSIISEMLTEFREAGVLTPGASPFRLEVPPTEILSFPGKVLADAEGGRLFIADSGHHRIVVTDLDGLILETIGSGEDGLADGATTGARFNRPQGMALADGMLYVADTENHAVRRVDLAERVVETIAGSGRQGVGPIAPGPALATDLRSPWDVEVDGTSLYIAMAGSHQLWTLDLAAEQLALAAGSGAENIIDGPAPSAALAQPSGIVRDGAALYFADSETSSVRVLELTGGGQVRTLVGRGLFDFGDQDGESTIARFQHALGVEVRDGAIYVADTYNNKLRRLDPAARTVSTLAGTGEPGRDDGELAKARFYEPGGLSAAGGVLYVADTNNHAIRVVDEAAGSVRTLDIRL